MSIDTFWLIIGSNIGSIIAIGAILATAWTAIRQIREAASSRSLEGFLAIAETIKEDREIRASLYKKLINFRHLTNEQKQQLLSDPILTSEVEQVCISFDQMGVLVANGLIPRDVAFSMYFDVILRTWNLVEPFILEERKRRKSDVWMMCFEILKDECWSYWLKQLKKHPEWKYMRKPGDIFHYRREVKTIEKSKSTYKFCPNCGQSLTDVWSETADTKREVCLNCDFIHYPTSKPCVAVLILKESKILLVRRAVEPFKNYWDIPGGFLEEAEHPEKGALREVREETGLNIEIKELLEIFMDKYGSEQDATLNICYVASVVGGELSLGSDAKEAEWFDLKDDLPRNIAFDWSKDAIKILQLRTT